MVNNVSIERDAILALRGIIASGVTDPISATRSGSAHFIMTSWPDRPVQYPVIILDSRLGPSTRMGANTEAIQVPVTIEAHVRSTNTKERDILAGSVLDYIRISQFGNSPISGTINQDLNHFRFLNAINLPPTSPEGEENVKSPKQRIQTKVLNFGYDFYTKG